MHTLLTDETALAVTNAGARARPRMCAEVRTGPTTKSTKPTKGGYILLSLVVLSANPKSKIRTGPAPAARRGNVRAFAFIISCVAILLSVAVTCGGQTRLAQGATVQRIAPEEEVNQDYVRFGNGDILTGEVREIADGEVRITPEMAGLPALAPLNGQGKSVAIPVEAVKEVVFKNNEKDSSFAADRLVLVNGESLLAKVTGVHEGNLVAQLPPLQEVDRSGIPPLAGPVNHGQDAHATVEISLANVAAIGFYRKGEILTTEEFSSGLPPTMRFEGGRWCIQNGWLLQTESQATESFASLPLSQTGVVVYEWTVNTTVGRSTGLYFMASDPGLSQKGAYFVRVLRNYVYLYLCTENQEVYCGSYRISLYRSRNEVRLTCDSDRGFIEATIDGSQVGRWRSSVPIKMGKYVILRADGRAAFDNFRVVQKAAAARPDVRGEREEETILRLVNGDKILGTMTGITERLVSFSLGHGQPAFDLEKEKLLYVRFDREVGNPPVAVAGTVVLTTQSDDRISGELVWLNEDEARIKSGLAGTLDLLREDVKRVIFREFP
jgi:hypothetical protein